MTIHRSCKIRIYPNAEQAQILIQRMGATRFAYNWCLERWKIEYEAGRKPTASGMAKLFRVNKPEWYAEMDSCIVDRAAANLGVAFKKFFIKMNRYPQFKRKGAQDSYQIKSDCLKVGDALKLPKCTPIKMSRPMFYEGKIVGNVTISRTAGRWYAAIPVETQAKPVSKSQAVVGIDLGIKTFATLSNGEKIENPKHLKEASRRLAIRQRSLSRKVKGSNNYGKCKAIVARTHATVANKRKGFLHGVTSDLAKRFGAVAIEDLHIKGMVKNHRLARSISDAGFGEFRRQLEYKMVGRVLVVDRFFPSSKTCSACGSILDTLPLSIREWACPACGESHDRDLNAAKNIHIRATRPEFTPVIAPADMMVASKGHQDGNHLEISNA